MTSFIEWVNANPVVATGVGAFFCGVALMYLVMRRTQKHRIAHPE
jgi:hypothetical protein